MERRKLKPVYVIGVGMTKFEKPGRRENFDYPDIAKEAIYKALSDAHIGYGEIQHASVGYVYGDSTCGQRALYEVGMSGIPVYNVNNNCSTGSTALLMSAQLIQGGVVDCCLALGFEKMKRGSLTTVFDDRANPMETHVMKMSEISGFEPAPVTPQMFGNAGLEHMRKYGSTELHMAKIAYKNHKHSVNNPNSQFQKEYSLEKITASPHVFGPLTRLQCCPTSDGGAAAILASEEFVNNHKLWGQAVQILGMEMCTDLPSTFQDKCPMKLVGYDMTKAAAQRLYTNTGVGPDEVDVIELHDCFSANELISYEALGLCNEGEAGKMIDNGDNTYGGKYVINPSGGLISKGHPLGATGIAQCAELCWQLRGIAGKRQVKGAKLGLQHNIGLGGAAVVALYLSPSENVNNVGYNPEVFESEKVFQTIENVFNTDGSRVVAQIRGIFCFIVTDGPKNASRTWIVDAKNGTGLVTEGRAGNQDVTITIADRILCDIMTGKISAQKAFLEGKMKVNGNMGLLTKLPELQKQFGSHVSRL